MTEKNERTAYAVTVIGPLTDNRDRFASEAKSTVKAHVFTATPCRPQTYDVLHAEKHHKNYLLYNNNDSSTRFI